MAPGSDDMADLDRPATLRDLRDLRVELRSELRSEFRSELRSELQRFATKEELRTELAALRAELATKVELQAAKEELRTEMSSGFADLRAYIDFSSTTLRNHFDLTAENFRTEFRGLFDWVHANTTSLATRVEALETGHGARLTSVETRVTRLEVDRN
jgi:hypothetical protein